MGRHRIAVIPGDGIGREVIPEGVKVAEAACRVLPGVALELTFFDWGTDYYLRTGRMMPENGLEILKGFDAIYFGAVGDPNRVPDHVTLHGLLLSVRKAFDLCVMVRPAYLYPGVPTPLAGKQPGQIDLVVVRENTEGEYTDAGGRLYPGTEAEVAIQTAMFTRRGIRRAVRYAFELARSRNRKRRVTSITKSNVQRYGMGLWDEVFKEEALNFPDVESETKIIDAAALEFVRHPEHFDVVVASNLFGDILGDLSAGLIGSIGLAPSASLDPSRRYPSVFEPAHGSGPDIAGKGIANPVAAILAAAFMMEFLQEAAAAERIYRAVREVLAGGGVRTPDLGGDGTTVQVGDAVVDHVEGRAV